MRSAACIQLHWHIQWGVASMHPHKCSDSFKFSKCNCFRSQSPPIEMCAPLWEILNLPLNCITHQNYTSYLVVPFTTLGPHSPDSTTLMLLDFLVHGIFTSEKRQYESQETYSQYIFFSQKMDQHI